MTSSYIYPAAARTERIVLDGLSALTGPTDGQPVVLLNGLGLAARRVEESG